MFRTKPENNELLVRFKIHIQGITKMLEFSSEGPHFKIHKFKSIWSTDSDRDFFFKKIPNSWEGLGELAWNYPIGNTMILHFYGLFLISVSLTSWLSRLSVSWPPAGFPVYGGPVLPELPYSSVVWPCVSKSSAAGLFGSDTDPPAASFRADSTSSHLDRNSHTVRY